jgi:hypothetical protein
MQERCAGARKADYEDRTLDRFGGNCRDTTTVTFQPQARNQQRAKLIFRSCSRLLRPHAQLVEPLHNPFHAAVQLRADCTGITRDDLGAHDNPLAGHAGYDIHKYERSSSIRIWWYCGT